MPIKFPCRNCKTKLKLSSRAAGRTFECPQCGHKQRAPSPRAQGAAPSSADLGGVPPAKSKDLTEAVPRPAKRPSLNNPAAASVAATKPRAKPSTGLPFDDDEWDQALNPYEPPKEEEKPKLPGYDDDNPRQRRKELRWARRGLKTVNAGLSGLGLSFILMIILSFISGDEPGGGVAVLAMVAFGVYLLSGSLLFIGPYLCLATPEKTGARFPVVLTCVAQTMLVLLIFLLATGGVTNPSEIVGVVMMLFVAAVTSYFGFVQYLVKLAKHIKRDDIAESASMVIILGVVNTIMSIITFACPAAIVALPDYAFILGTLGFIAWLSSFIGGLIAIGKYISSVHQLSQAL